MSNKIDAVEFNMLLKSIKIDASSFEQIYLFFHPKIIAYINSQFRRLGLDFAEEIAQDFFVYLLEHCHTIPYVRTPLTWAYTVSNNIAKRRAQFADKLILIAPNDLNKYFPNYTANFNYGLRNIILQEKFANLKSDEYSIITAKFWLGYSLKEIAAAKGKSYIALRVKYYRCIKKMREILTKLKFK